MTADHVASCRTAGGHRPPLQKNGQVFQSDLYSAKVMAQSRLKASLRAFRHRDYRLFFAGQLTSLVGTWMQTVAQSWLVYRLTGSATLLGLVGFASQFPIFLLSPVAGAVADSYPRRRSMIVIQTSMMLLAFPLAALTLTNRIQVCHVMVL